MRGLVALGWAALAVTGCETTVYLGEPGTGAGAAQGPPPGSGGYLPHEACASADGVRVCGGDEGCPAIEPPDCPGVGCTPAVDVQSFAELEAGVCWTDLPDKGATPCVACADGEVCVQRKDNQLVCASIELCEALWDLGATSACRYADKTRYDHQHLPWNADCPATPGAGVLCGGGCGACPGPPSWLPICTGRSPRHAYGLCVPRSNVDEAVNGVEPCIRDKGGDVVLECLEGLGVEPMACAVFDVPEPDRPAAEQHGMCMTAAGCKAAAKVMPGGLHCYDRDGESL